ncbi:hypothetical protein BV22DRAFT_1009461 [Leucogyrophana mollusca]|uniref:Uncharacterized protein n=1 Tax=Leucogyrophana mollusca TaxID=85980 RepID=A0ACB8BM01_9AGAM|nr:hypothetical protein BV22DRAFT_1009461 [Leucogyrophana mollusca]
MTDYLRRLVSGNKARFKDGNLNLELDLVYVTDQVIVMGYPATGIEGLYRNRRDDAKKFLSHRHGKNFWVFNFCPVKENSYPASVFDGRVSRYPFPDHHAPPLSILPLAAREMRAWLSGSRDRVVVLHCKAGKGRSGTLACTYLLSLDVYPTPPSLEQNPSTKNWIQERAEEWMEVMPNDDSEPSDAGASLKISQLSADVDASAHEVTQELNSNPLLSQASASISSESNPSPPIRSAPSKVLPTSLQDVLDLHTSRRMKAPTSPSTKSKAGVSIPSQRRWLFYWSLLLANEAPVGFWSLDAEAPKPKSKVRLTQVKLRMKELSGVKMNLVKAANMVIGRTSFRRQEAGNGHVWVSLARYDDDMVDALERWERRTRDDDGHMGKRKSGSEHIGNEELATFFQDGTWDAQKMVRSFARMGVFGDSSVHKGDTGEGVQVTLYTLRPLSEDKWVKIRDELPPAIEHADENPVPSEANSMYDMTLAGHEHGIVLDAHREVRIKLYMGQVFMGWLWIIPAFHMSTPSSPSEPTRVVFQRKEIDFPLGVGSALIDVEVLMEWCSDSESVQPPQKDIALGDEQEEPAGVAATMQAIIAGDVGEAVEAKQATED